MTDVVHPQQHVAGHLQHPQAVHAGSSGLGHHSQIGVSSSHSLYPPEGHHHPNGSSPGLSSGPVSATASSSSLSLPVSGSAASSSLSGLHNPYGVLPPDAPRSYTPVKLVGDGSFGTVWLCDWHSPLPAGTTLSPMQCGAGARPEWAGKRLVAVKRMKRVWERGWEEAGKLKELESLRKISSHPNIIPLYDAFLQPSKELYFVFECMEGNLYQLTKSRKGRPMAGGLVASIFHQTLSGLAHIHDSGYFHRDMKPENLLVTTIGLQDYTPVRDSPIPPGTRLETDVVVILKIADFGLAIEINASPPFEEYVSTRWYRAPEVLLRSRDYGPAVDIWAMGTIMAEVINLKPIFPGQSEVDQVYRICAVLGNPSREYGLDERGKLRGGGDWDRGIKLAHNVGFGFPKMSPIVFASLFDALIPRTLIDCISECLRYNPRHRITPRNLLNHTYFRETVPKIQAAPYIPAMPEAPSRPSIPAQALTAPYLPSSASSPLTSPPPPPDSTTSSVQNVPNRDLPPSHSVPGPTPGFNLVDPAANRTLPPLQSAHQGSGTRAPFFPQYRDVSSPVMPPTPSSASSHSHAQAGQLHRSSIGGGGYDGHHHSSPGLEHSPSPNVLGSQRRTTGASALVDQLKRLDLPAAELSSYGRRAPPSAVNRAAGQAPPRWQGGPAPVVQQLPYDNANGFNRMLPPPRQSSTSLASSGHGSSSSHLATPAGVASPSQPTPHVRSPYDDELSMPPPPAIDREPVRRLDVAAANAEVEAARKAALAPPKKKKWGLSSVFGSNNDSKTNHSLVSVAEESSRSSVPLKRSQSISDRADSNTSLTSGEMHHHQSDPKMAAKEAKKQAKALEMAKREAAEKASRERARAVMMKRERMVEATAEHYKAKASGQSSANGPPVPANYLIPSSSSSLGLQSPSTASLATRAAPPPARSSAALQRLPPNMAALASHQRHKSRRRDHDDDHSTSSLDTNSFRSPSVATFHSVDSDPGPSRLARQYSSSVGVDPALGIRGSGYQTNSQGSNSSPQLYSLPQGSGSIENQLSRDFSTHARLANSPGGSYSSLVSPSYSNPYGRGGSESSSLQLPSLASQGLPAPDRSGYVNPMFHVRDPSAADGPHTTLPPFSQLASVADGRHQQHLPR